MRPDDAQALELVAPAPYVLFALGSKITGYTVRAMERKVADGVWREGHEYRKSPDGRLHLSIEGYKKWVESRSDRG